MPGTARRLTRPLLGLGALAATAAGVWWASPWPSVLLLRRLGKRADSERPTRLAGNAARVPAAVATVALDRTYGPARSQRFDVFAPPGNEPCPTLIWVHGGGFIGGTKDDVRDYLRVLAGKGMTTVGVEYTLAPRGRYPGPVRELAQALTHLRQHAEELRIDPERIVLAGDSAGAHIVAQAAYAIVDADYARAAALPRPLRPEQLRALVLACGVFDLTIGSDAPGMAGWVVRTVLWAYSGHRRAVDNGRFALASLVEHVPTGLPATYVTAGNEDPLRGHTTRMARALVAAGVEVVDDIVPRDHEPGLPHDYQMDLRLERARDSLERIAELVRRTTA